MNSVLTVFVLLVFVVTEQRAGSFFLEKSGSCPVYKVMSRSALCDQELAECDIDYVCDGDLKCCEDERCGVSKCTKPVRDVQPTWRTDRCPIEESASRMSGCRLFDTKFCFKTNCQRCCTHLNDCNPAKGILVPYDECTQPTPLNLTRSVITVKSGQSLELKCQVPKENSLRRWSKLVNGQKFVWPTSHTEIIDKDLVLKIQNAVVTDNGLYLCEIVYLGKSYSREVQLTVLEPDSYKNICLMPKVLGNCTFNFLHFYYDVKDDSCKSFQYGGCNGNNNNFANKSVCERKCKGSLQSCPKFGLPLAKNCPEQQSHECIKNGDCSNRRACCLIGCKRRCIDPSKPFTRQSETTKRPYVTTRAIVNSNGSYTSCGERICRFYSECRENKSGTKECHCPRSCNFRELKKVCGRDVLTGEKRAYRSMCFLKVRSCRLQREIIPISKVDCYKEGLGLKIASAADRCKLKDCSPHARCVINRFDNQPQCLCPQFCSLVRNLVCGSNGQTYRNDCFLRVLSCRRNLYVQKVRQGPC
ncbi:agrin-like isoform X2 [Rhopilema esculentum]|uniref:agrin-like isoform X2 n=1 Tax=Rhopilema esculentum TaxID=499914 RepID=UPI0031D0221A